MELYYTIGITDRARSAQMESLCREAGAALVTTMLGHGTATGAQLARYGLSPTEKAITGAVLDGEGRKTLFRSAKQQLYIDIPGNGVLLAVPMKSVSGGRTLAFLTDGKSLTGGVPSMQFDHELIMVILNEGYSDMVMDAARSAGAAGGTVMHAKGTGAAAAEKFLGVTLASEKDLIYIIANAREKTDIMNAINAHAGTGTKAGAISFSLPVSSVVGLRRLEED